LLNEGDKSLDIIMKHAPNPIRNKMIIEASTYCILVLILASISYDT